MSITRINAVVFKQLQDTLKNKAVLIQFVMFPMMAFILTFSAKDFGMEQNFFVNMFSTMYITMAPIIVISSIVSEDKEKGSLRALRMANVKSIEYMLGITFYVFVLCLLGLLFLSIVGEYFGNALINYLVSNIIGLLISCFIGSIIGILSNNQSSASGLSVPAMLLFSFLPMMSMFNPSIRNFSKYVYSQQTSDIINGLSTVDSWIILLINFIIVALSYLVLFKRNNEA